MAKKLMKGNEAIGEAAIIAGCRHFFGYPITPQSELPHYMARRMPEVGGVFLQAESEISAINMLYGASGCGARVMTSSSSPGISLKMEGISCLVAAELPGVIVNIVRGGPGLGNIQAAQSDYFQAVKGGGHGDYRLVVYAPSSVQEIVDLTIRSFDISDKYRNPAMILGDGVLGQMMEPVVFPKIEAKPPEKLWATTGAKGRERNIISTLRIMPEESEKFNWKLVEKYKKIETNEVLWEDYLVAGADVVIVAYGTSARIAKGAVDIARSRGLKAGVLRPITLWPFPSDHLCEVADKVKAFLVVEMSTGQMVEDVRLAVIGKKPVHFHGRPGGMLPVAKDIVENIEKILKGGFKNE